jgi:hypothetical protein
VHKGGFVFVADVVEVVVCVLEYVVLLRNDAVENLVDDMPVDSVKVIGGANG